MDYSLLLAVEKRQDRKSTTNRETEVPEHVYQGRTSIKQMIFFTEEQEMIYNQMRMGTTLN